MRSKRPIGRALVAILLLTLALAIPRVASAEKELGPTVILVSIDGFRWDFRDRGPTPTLDRLAARGVRAKRLIPVFPTKTFPNHYSLVTGLYPSRHGLVANNFYDPVFDSRYALGKRDEVGNGRWYAGEPIWVTAEKTGLKTAPMFWPGSEAEIDGVRPTYWLPYDGSISNSDRVKMVLGWLDLPPASRPSFVTLYFSTVDDAAHRYGPEPSRQLRAAVAEVDRALGLLVRGLRERGLEDRIDLVIVADHGHSSISPRRVIVLDRFVDIAKANVVDWNPVLALWPAEEDVDKIYADLKSAHPRLSVYRRGELPAHLRFADNRRIAPIVGIADPGWSITDRRRLESCRRCFAGGNHGYDPSDETMGAIFVAAGPSFRRGVVVEPFENVHLYELLCRILDLEPAPNDGDPRATRALLSPSAWQSRP